MDEGKLVPVSQPTSGGMRLMRCEWKLVAIQYSDDPKKSSPRRKRRRELIASNPLSVLAPNSYDRDSPPNGNLFAFWQASFSFLDFGSDSIYPFQLGSSAYGHQVLNESPVMP